ncbi:MAG TPA: hypothetical protein VHW73_07345, partial [Rudaea sp.]|nr:hypothetical protein [Rudaea sp.]
LVCFGSSFNVLDRAASLREAARLLQACGWIACLWNHRDLDDPVQRKIETVIRRRLPDYALGTRRENPSDVIRESGLFDAARNFDCRFTHHASRDIFVAGFRAHATLVRQAGRQLDAILDDISHALPARVSVPFSTRIWVAQKLHG